MTQIDGSTTSRKLAGIRLGAVLLTAAVVGAALLWWWTQRRPAYGIEARVAWTDSHVFGTPEPPDPFRTERLFPKVKFFKPTDIGFAPGSDRIFVSQLTGEIYSFPNSNDVEKPDLLLDCNKIKGLAKYPDFNGISLYGFTFHPQFRTHRFIYVCYSIGFSDYASATAYAKKYPLNTTASRVSRFTVDDADPPRADPASEKVIIAWPGGGHDGGCLKFGPDGDLYISTGDNGDPNPPDPFNIGQNVGDLRAKILRIDVDHPTAERAYSIPADNPFVKTPGARGEVFAYGLRNAWRYSFDRKTGDLWAGDVGWELWESVQHVVSGGNYGWSIMEGPQPVHTVGGKPGPTPIIAPAIALPHTEAASLTGGFVYRGDRLPALAGQYIFGDWETRRLWAAPVQGGKLGKYRTIAQTDQRIVAFGEDADGELYILDFEGGGVWRMIPSPPLSAARAFPRKLSETGLFSNVANQAPNPGVAPFDIIAPQWVDGASSERFIAVPSSDPIKDDEDGKRVFPANTVFVRTLSLPMTVGDLATQKKIETQLLHFDGRQWHGYSYQWNDSQDDAALVDGEGRDVPLTIVDPAAPNGRRTQAWRFNSRAQCMTCHTSWSGYALAFNEPQLDRVEQFQNGDTSMVADNQVRVFRHIGLLPTPFVPQPPKDGTRKPIPPIVLVNPYDEGSHSLEERARSYLHVNCSVCHRFGGGGSALIDLRENLTLKETKLIWGPMLGMFSLPDAQVVCPGDPSRSVLYYRMAKTGLGHMPHLGSNVVDEKGLNLMAEWIASLRDKAGGATPTPATLVQTAQENAALQVLLGGASGEQAVDAVDKLLIAPSSALKLLTAIDEGRLPATVRTLATHDAMEKAPESVRDLFARFSAEPMNAKPKLGANPDIDQLLAMPGDAERGRKVFFELAGGLCSRCHQIANQGIEFGPNLTQIGAKYNRAELLDNILHPSKTIAPGFETYILRTRTGDAFAGFVVSKTDKEVVLKTADLKLVHVKAEDVDRLQMQTISAMPEGMLIDLEPQQAADLLEYLSLRK